MIQFILPLLPILVFLQIWILRLRSIAVVQTAPVAAGNALLEAAVLWGIGVVGISEILSLFGSLRVDMIVAVWLLICVTCLAITLKCQRQMPTNRLLELVSWIRLFVSSFPAGALILCVILLGTFLTAVQAAPNTADSMTYHLSRVAHWAQNGSVAHYPTSILRQLFQSPWSAFAITQFYILSGGDHLVNLVQWFAFPASLIAIALLSIDLGLPRKGVIIAVLFFATTPMALLQASTTQNDLITAFWLLCLLVFLLRYLRSGGLIDAGMAGCALGLAINTKQTAYLFAFPFMLGFILAAIRRFRHKSLLHIAVIAVLIFGINAGHWSRNYAVFGSPMGPKTSTDIKPRDGHLTNFHNENLDLPMLTSNIIRNVAIHLGTPFASVNNVMERAIVAMHRGLGISLNDPRNNAVAPEPYKFEGLSASEDTSGNPIQAVLIILFTCAFLAVKPLRTRSTTLYFIALIAGFIIFCGAIKWMPYNTRLHLPLLALASPLIGFLFIRPKWNWVVGLLILLSAITSFYWITCSPLRPWGGEQSIWTTQREEQYFLNRPYLEQSYLSLAAESKRRGWKSIGLLTRHSDFEYPFFALLKNSGVRIEHVDVLNPSHALSNSDFIPDAVIVTGLQGRITAEDLAILSKKFRRRAVLGQLYIFDNPPD